MLNQPHSASISSSKQEESEEYKNFDVSGARYSNGKIIFEDNEFPVRIGKDSYYQGKYEVSINDNYQIDAYTIKSLKAKIIEQLKGW